MAVRMYDLVRIEPVAHLTQRKPRETRGFMRSLLCSSISFAVWTRYLTTDRSLAGRERVCLLPAKMEVESHATAVD